jgi:sulfhydrogenase subunit beta (sulfur reductase)
VLIDSAVQAGYRFIAPMRDNSITRFRETAKAGDIVLDEIIPTKSAKEYFLADHETILRYKFGDGGSVDVEAIPPEEFARPTVIFGARPCDAAAGPIVREVMTWDYDDNFFLERLRNNIVIAIACVEADESCFCTSVDVQPDGTDGVDILLRPTSAETGAEQEYAVEAVTDKGMEFIDKTEGWGAGDARQSPAIEELKANLKPKFDHRALHDWLAANFNHTIWKEATVACIGCGTCTFVCPTCHCFDIVDEGDIDGGRRVKNWDYCQGKLFTLHTSGHNPREFQFERYRQRIQHKFRYYVDKFGRILCTGCGRCQRACPVDHAMLAIIRKIDELAKQPAAKE